MRTSSRVLAAYLAVAVVALLAPAARATYIHQNGHWLWCVGGVCQVVVPPPPNYNTPLFECSFDDGSSGTSSDTGFKAFNKCADEWGLSADGGDSAHCYLDTGQTGYGATCHFNGTGFSPDYDIHLPGSHRAMTIIYQEKYSTWPLSGQNSKHFRPYYRDSNGADWAFAGASTYFDGMWYESYFGQGTSAFSSTVNATTTSCACTNACSNTGFFCDGTHPCGGSATCGAQNACDNDFGCPEAPYVQTLSPGNSGGTRFKYGWSGDFSDGGWHTVQQYMLLPSSGNCDGALKLWIDGVQIMAAVSLCFDPQSSSNGTFSIMSWFPDEGGSGELYHSIDGLVIYDGEVDP